MGPKEKLWFYLLLEIKKIPKNKLSNKTSSRNEINNQIQNIIKRTMHDTGRSCQEVTNAAHYMDQYNLKLLRAEVYRRGRWNLPPDGNLISINGDEFLYKMKHAVKKTVNKNNSSNNITIHSLKTNNANVGNNNKNNYTNINVHDIDISHNIATLKQYGATMSNKDKRALDNLCDMLEKNYFNPSKNKLLSKFKPFITKTWNIIGSSLSTILIKIGLKHLGL